MSNRRSMQGGWASKASLGNDTGRKTLCRWCSLEVPHGRQTFCSNFCVEEWKLRTNPSHLRQRVYERDHGICALCQEDCQAALIHLKRSRGSARLKLQLRWGITAHRKSLWDADHIVAVAEGGGECDLANMRTLCLVCHRQQTAKLRIRLKSRQTSQLTFQ